MLLSIFTNNLDIRYCHCITCWRIHPLDVLLSVFETCNRSQVHVRFQDLQRWPRDHAEDQQGQLLVDHCELVKHCYLCGNDDHISVLWYEDQGEEHSILYWNNIANDLLSVMVLCAMLDVQQVQGMHASTSKQKDVHHPWNASRILLSYPYSVNGNLLLHD